MNNTSATTTNDIKSLLDRIDQCEQEIIGRISTTRTTTSPVCQHLRDARDAACALGDVLSDCETQMSVDAACDIEKALLEIEDMKNNLLRAGKALRKARNRLNILIGTAPPRH